MASITVASATSAIRDPAALIRLPQEMNDLRISNDKDMEATVINGSLMVMEQRLDI